MGKSEKTHVDAYRSCVRGVSRRRAVRPSGGVKVGVVHHFDGRQKGRQKETIGETKEIRRREMLKLD